MAGQRQINLHNNGLLVYFATIYTKVIESKEIFSITCILI